jgi:hypothetical protein
MLKNLLFRFPALEQVNRLNRILHEGPFPSFHLLSSDVESMLFHVVVVERGRLRL